MAEQPSARQAAEPWCGEQGEPDWDALVKQFQPLINSVCRRFGLGPEDAADVSQEVWLKVFDHLHALRDRRALPGWIKTTTTHAACSMIRKLRRVTLLADPSVAESASWSMLMASADAEVDDDLLRDERCEAVRDALAELPQRSRQLVDLLVADPPVHYEEISSRMDMPVGSIGPTRARCLARLADTAPIRALREAA